MSREDNTCYVERSKVRMILIASNTDNETTQELLREVDALPIFVASDFASAAAAPPSDRTEIAWLLLSRWENIARYGGEKWLANHPLVQETTDLLNEEATAVTRPNGKTGDERS